MGSDTNTLANQEPSERRNFLKSATLIASAAGAAGASGAALAEQGEKHAKGAMANSHADHVPGPKHDGPMTRRWIEQRWVLDNVIRANGIDWDQPRPLWS